MGRVGRVLTRHTGRKIKANVVRMQQAKPVDGEWRREGIAGLYGVAVVVRVDEGEMSKWIQYRPGLLCDSEKGGIRCR